MDIKHFPAITNRIWNYVDECILMHHTDMFFTGLVRNIVEREYQQKTIPVNDELEISLTPSSIDTGNLIRHWEIITPVILKEVAGIIVPDLNKSSEERQLEIKSVYSDLIEYGGDYRYVISEYVIFRPELASVLEIDINEEAPLYFGFFQLCMNRGYEIAKKRIHSNSEKINLLQYEITTFPNSVRIIKIFPSIFGFIERQYLVDIAKKSLIQDFVFDSLKKNGFVIVHDLELTKILKTKLIVKYRGSIYYYKRREINDEYAPFGEQNRTNPYAALLVHGQINLSEYKDEN